MVKKILVMDDYPAIVEIISKELRGRGHDVTTASSGENALAICRSTDFDVIITDFSMPPGMHGIELARRIVVDLGKRPKIFMFTTNQFSLEEVGPYISAVFQKSLDLKLLETAVEA